MKERPILYKGEMVRGILDLIKTKTRRLSGLEDVNKQPDDWTFRKMDVLDWMTKPSAKGKYGAYFESDTIEPKTLSVCPQVCPYGQPGDYLWVKETFCNSEPIRYRADGIWKDGDQIWTPSIFMPRWASRILLEIVTVQVERLQNITEEDAIAEGVDGAESEGAKFCGWYEKPIRAYHRLWDQINANRGFGWDTNPWVWVIEFKKVSK